MNPALIPPLISLMLAIATVLLSIAHYYDRAK